MLVDAAGLIALASNMGNATSFNEQRNLETYNYGTMLEHPFLFIKLMGMSILDNITGSLQGTRYLLILGADMPLWTAIFIGVVLLKGTSTDLAENNHPVSLMQKRVIACVCAVIYLLSIVAFIPYTETGAATVQGLQGRYYLPLFPILALWGQRVFRSNGQAGGTLVFVMVCLNVFTVLYLLLSALVFIVV